MKQKKLILLSLITTSLMSQNLFGDILFYYSSAILPTIMAKKIPKSSIQSGTVIDDKLYYSKVCIDTNKNSLCDEGELRSDLTPQSDGEFTFEKSPQIGPLLTIGGRYGNINKFFRGSLRAPYNSTVISPLTSAIYSLMSAQNRSLREADTIVKATFEIEDLNVALNNFNPLKEIESTDAKISGAAHKALASQTQIQILALSIGAIAADSIPKEVTMQKAFDELVVTMQREKKLPDAQGIKNIIKDLTDEYYTENETVRVSIKAVAAYAAKKIASYASDAKKKILSSTQDAIRYQNTINIKYTQDFYYEILNLIDKTKNRANHLVEFDSEALDEIVALQAREGVLRTERELALQKLLEAKSNLAMLKKSKDLSETKFLSYVEAEAYRADMVVKFAEADRAVTSKSVEVAEAEKIIFEFSDISKRDASALNAVSSKKLSNASNELRVANEILKSINVAVTDDKNLDELQEIRESVKQNIEEEINRVKEKIATYAKEAQEFADEALVDAKKAREIANYHMRGENLALKAEEAAKLAQKAVVDVDIIIPTDYSVDEAEAYVAEAKNQAAIASKALSDMSYITINATQLADANALPTRVEAIKLLKQSAYTSYETQIDYVMRNGEMAWIDKQLATPSAFDNPDDEHYGYIESFVRQKIAENPARFKPYMLESPETTYPESLKTNSDMGIFYNNVLPAKMFDSPDQLRHRMALALNEIIVVSTAATAGPTLWWKGVGLVKMYDDLYRHSFGNYRDVLKASSMSGAMAYYLTFLGNMKENIKYLGRQLNNAPDENYARELMQLFSIGVYELNMDGSKKLDGDKNPIPSYSQEDVSQLARVFTGWDWWSGPNSQDYGDVYGSGSPNLFNLIHDNHFNPYFHEYGEKVVLGETIEAADIGDIELGKLTAEDKEKLMPLGEADINAAIDILMKNDNMAPHVSRHLIMRLVTSNPTPAYIERVATAFETGYYDGHGTGKKGDLKVTVEAILKDDEARGINAPKDFGKTDEYLLAFTHYASRLNVAPLPYLTFSGGKKVYNKYSYKWWGDMKQLPLGAPNVFNHYTNEDMPSDKYFMDESLVAPELATRTNKGNHAIMNMTSKKTYDVYEHVDLDFAKNIRLEQAETLEEWLSMSGHAAGWMFNSKDIYDQYLPLREAAWGGSVQERTQSTSELIDILSIKFLGETLPADYKALILEEAVEIQENGSKDAKRADRFINAITRYITATPFYMNLH